MFGNETSETRPAKKKPEALGFMNFNLVLKDGSKKRLGYAALEKGNPLHEALAAKFAENEDYSPNIEMQYNESNNKDVSEYADLL